LLCMCNIDAIIGAHKALDIGRLYERLTV